MVADWKLSVTFEKSVSMVQRKSDSWAAGRSGWEDVEEIAEAGFGGSSDESKMKNGVTAYQPDGGSLA